MHPEPFILRSAVFNDYDQKLIRSVIFLFVYILYIRHLLKSNYPLSYIYHPYRKISCIVFDLFKTKLIYGKAIDSFST